MIYSAGPCSVRFDSSDALFVRAIDTGKVFFLCPSCGCAWAEPPTAGEVETIDPPEVFAPAGFSLATAADIRTAGWAHRIAFEYPDADVERVEDFKGFRPGGGSGESAAHAGYRTLQLASALGSLALRARFVRALAAERSR